MSQGPSGPAKGHERFEKEGLLLIERGERLPHDLIDDPECLEAAAQYRDFRQELRRDLQGQSEGLEGPLSPPGDWQAKVWAGIARRKKRRRIWQLGWATALSLLIGVLVLKPGGPSTDPTSQSPAFAVEILSGQEIRRGASAEPGDRLIIRAEQAPGDRLEIRVYLNDRSLLLRCQNGRPTAPRCRARDGQLEAEWQLERRGRYQSLLVRLPRPGEVPDGAFSGDLEQDSAALLEMGAELILGKEVDVR